MDHDELMDHIVEGLLEDIYRMVGQGRRPEAYQLIWGLLEKAEMTEDELREEYSAYVPEPDPNDEWWEYADRKHDEMRIAHALSAAD